MTCAHCERLEEEVAYLRSELGLQRDDTQITKLTAALRIAPQTAQLILALYAAKGRVMSSLQLHEAMPEVRTEDRTLKTVDVQVWRARKAIGRESISTAFGRGYFLTEHGMSIVRSALVVREVRAVTPSSFGDFIASRGAP